MKRYNLHGVAGLVERTKNRSTGLLMGLYAAEQTDLDVDERWAVVCETHGAIVSAPTLQLAHESMAYPLWCEECSGSAEAP